MGNSRKFRPGRVAARRSQKQQIRALHAQLGYQQGLNEALVAQLEASRMERPPDLDEWIENDIIPLMDKEEREAWDAMDADELEAFKDRLGQRINASKLMLDGDGSEDPTPAAPLP